MMNTSYCEVARTASVLAAALLLTLQAPAADFSESGRRWMGKNQATLDEANKLALEGDTVRANALMVQLTENDADPIGAFIIGNMLYKSDPAASYKLHERAYKAFPLEPATALEMAMQQHRRGEYLAAIPNYRTVLKADMGPQFASLLADCLLRSGQLREAVQAWKDADHSSNHTGIDFAIYEIYGKISPVQRRGDLIAEIKAGRHERLPELIFLDLHFDRDWWNTSVFEQGLAPDLALAAEKLGKDSPAYRDLADYARLAQEEEPKAAAIREAWTKARFLLGKKSRLPASSLLARAMCELAVRHELVDPTDLWKWHEAALRERLKTKDRDALHLLCWLGSLVDYDKVAAWNALGWKEWQDPEFAAAHIASRYTDKKLTSPDDPELKAALAVKPEDGYLQLLRLELAGKQNLTAGLIVDSIKAEFRELSPGMGARDSYRLKALFTTLEEKL